MLIDILSRTLADRCQKNPRYSLRAFARSLQIDSSTLSALLSGRRPLTLKSSLQLLDRLGVEPELRTEVLRTLSGDPAEGGDRGSQKSYIQLENEAFEAISSWEHFALLALLDTQPKRRDLRSLASRLAIPPAVALDALRRLERLALARRSAAGAWSTTGQPLTTQSEVPNSSLRKANRQCIEKALDSLENDPVEIRSITGITLAADSRKLPLANAMILDFRRKLARILEVGEADQVYRLNIQLFPLTQARAPNHRTKKERR